uniref:Retinoic acid receptor responder protein 2 n=1 Tax=Acanthochromis polyacanthus TaxID=80966 RepID=A0A3Q1GIK7_9TELE
MAALLLFVVSAAAVLISKAQEPNNELGDQYRNGVDLALKQLSLHAGVHHHFRFLRSLQKSEIEGDFGMKHVYIHFYLKPTRCAKGTTDSSPQRCPFRNDRPLMDCVVCYRTVEDVMETHPKPYVHCIQRPRLTEEMTTNRLEHCKKMSYNSGAPTLLAVSTG